jgi:diguanylate cyclase (GGDEF)-like protein
MDIERMKHFMMRHRTSLRDFSILVVVFVVGLYLVFEYDLFKNSAGVSVHEKAIELDEALLLGGVMAVGLLIFSIRRYIEQRRETAFRAAAEQKVRMLAFQDALTGLANRRKFDDALKAAIATPPREGAVHAVFLLDLNGFKKVNDVYGHASGDQVLTVVAQRLLQAMRDGDLVARFGGDEFAILALHLVDAEAASNIASRVIDALKEPLTIGPIKCSIGSGIGISLIPDDAVTMDQALRKADLALYRAKEERTSAVEFFEEDMDERVRERQWLVQELRTAVSEGGICVYFQPSVDLNTKRIVGFEAFPRWFHSSFGEIAPDRFIPLAEQSGMIHELADHVLRQACTAARNWPIDVALSINVFSGQLKDKTLDKRIMEILRETGLPPQRLEIEIDESALARAPETTRKILGRLREAGVRISLDNFGTGYLSFLQSQNLKIDRVKINSKAIHSMMSERKDAGVVRAMISLAHGLSMTIAAEGVEHSAQQESLILTRCEQGQGHLYGNPVSAEQTTRLIETSMQQCWFV